MTFGHMARVSVLMRRQDDPKKCTAARMIRFGLASAVHRAGRSDILLHPYSRSMLTAADAREYISICILDCSWKRAPGEFVGRIAGRHRYLPPLLAGNPVNYSKIGMLSSAEAAAAALYIVGFPDVAGTILDKFRWGHTFLDLNGDMLREYAGATTQEQACGIAASYGLAWMPR